MSILFQLPVTVERDGWDWAVIAVTIALFVSGTISFSYWFFQIRRRPEAKFIWEYFNSSKGSFDQWNENVPRSLAPGEDLRIKIAVVNVGDAFGDNLLVNIVVPQRIRLGRWNEETQQGEPDPEATFDSTDHFVGVEAEAFRCRYLSSKRHFWSTGDALTWDLTITAPSNTAAQGEVRMAVKLSQDRLNQSGRRVLPSLKASEESEQIDRESSLRTRRSIGWIKAQKHVVCRRGKRVDYRTLTLVSRATPTVPGDQATEIDRWENEGGAPTLSDDGVFEIPDRRRYR